jgi:hypothetical protein
MKTGSVAEHLASVFNKAKLLCINCGRLFIYVDRLMIAWNLSLALEQLTEVVDLRPRRGRSTCAGRCPICRSRGRCRQ